MMQLLGAGFQRSPLDCGASTAFGGGARYEFSLRFRRKFAVALVAARAGRNGASTELSFRVTH